MNTKIKKGVFLVRCSEKENERAKVQAQSIIIGSLNSKMLQFGKQRFFFCVLALILIQSILTLSLLLMRFASENRRTAGGLQRQLLALNQNNASLDPSDMDLIFTDIVAPGENFSRSDQNGSSLSDSEEKARVTMHIFALSRSSPLGALLDQLARADYSGERIGPVELQIHVDASGPAELLALADTFAWAHGPKAVVPANATALDDAWAGALPHSEQEVLVLLDAGARVSPHFLAWTMLLLDEYGGLGDRPRDPALLGLALCPPAPDDLPAANASAPPAPGPGPYLLAAPPARGAGVLFADRWLEFLRFYRVRAAPPFYNLSDARGGGGGGPAGRPPALGDPGLEVPGLRTGAWLPPWRRFLAEFAFARALYTLHAHGPAGEAFAAPPPPEPAPAAAPAAYSSSSEEEAAAAAAALQELRASAPLLAPPLPRPPPPPPRLQLAPPDGPRRSLSRSSSLSLHLPSVFLSSLSLSLPPSLPPSRCSLSPLPSLSLSSLSLSLLSLSLQCQ